MRPLVSVIVVCFTAAFFCEVSFAQNTGQDAATVVDGNARFQVLTPTLIRLEYSEEERFEDRPTFFAKERNRLGADYSTRVEDGWREIQTSKLLLRYRRGSGPFSDENVEVRVLGDDAFQARPTWENSQDPCTYGGVCQAEDGQIDAGEIGYDQARYLGTGFVQPTGGEQVAVRWTAGEVPASGEYVVSLRYASAEGGALILRRNDAGADTLTLPSTGAGDQWERVQKQVSLQEGTNTVTLAGTDGSARVHLDYLTISAPGDTLPEPGPDASPDNLGGWYRGLDYQDGPRQLHDGLLSRKGWFLLEDTETPFWTEDDWVAPRERPDTYRDGYFFGYGTDYKTALHDLARLTGPAPLLPRWAYGVWFSRYYPYTDEEYREEVIPAFREERVPMDVLVIDTDFKAPDQWNGWNWDHELFPQPEEFMQWTEEQGLKVSLNIHPSIQHADPQFPRADSIGEGLVRATGECPGWQGGTEPCSVWDWAQRPHAESYFALHAPFEEDGNDVWWFDWCCDNSFAAMEGLPQESWINYLYAERMRQQGERGFVLSRSGTSYQNRHVSEPGPWAEHRSTVHFTGDTYATWDMLDYQPKFTVQEGNVGIPYVSHDIGGFYGRHLPDELYARWVQMGTFQPIMRLHSRFGDRLPWDYQQPARDVAARFLRMREALVPYLYTLARASHDTGLPMTRGMYLEYPDREAAYRYDRQYLLGDQLLVAPVGQSGAEEQQACSLGQRCSGDEAAMEGDTEAGLRHGGFTGTGYVSGSDYEGAAWTVRDVPEAGTYEVAIRYANARGGDDRHEERTLSLYVNGEDVTQLAFPKTEAWDDWATVQTSVSLQSGENTLALRRDPDDTNNINIDFIGVTAPDESLPPLEESIPESAEKVVWFPPGQWVDFFTGRVHEGPRVDTLTVPLERMPVFAKAGGIVPMQPYMDHVGQKPVDPLIVRVHTGGDGQFRLYEDAGEGHGYQEERHAWTDLRYDEGDRTLTIGAAEGRYPGQLDARDYRIVLVNQDRPEAVSTGQETLSEIEPDAGEGWWYDAEEDNLVVYLSNVSTDQEVSVSVTP